MPLTDASIRALKPAAKTYKRADEKGLYVEVSPAGGKWWRHKYYMFGKEKRLSLGVYPEVGLKEAREKRDAARKLIAEGVDPSHHRKALKKTAQKESLDTFEVIAKEWFERFSTGWAKGHSARKGKLLERDVYPVLGKLPIASITAPQLLACLRPIEARTVDTAHRALRTFNQVFRYAVATGRCTGDPSTALRGSLAPLRNGHFPAPTDPKKLAHLLRLIDGYEGGVTVRNAIRLAPYVFVRPGELRQAEWKHVDLPYATWSMTLSKTHEPHIVPLSKQAVAILKDQHRVSGTGRYVFPTQSSEGKTPISDMAMTAALRSLEISPGELVMHGFRATARTLIDEVLNFRPEIIEQQMGHRVKDALGRAYNRTQYLDERRRMMEAWGTYLNDLKKQKTPAP